jgi:hypothetical protein
MARVSAPRSLRAVCSSLRSPPFSAMRDLIVRTCLSSPRLSLLRSPPQPYSPPLT